MMVSIAGFGRGTKRIRLDSPYGYEFLLVHSINFFGDER